MSLGTLGVANLTTPRALPNLQGWWDAQSETYNDGDQAEAHDRSGNSLDLLWDATFGSTSRPTFKKTTNGINNKNAWSFDGNDYISTAGRGLTSVYTGTTTVTTFAVVKMPANTTPFQVFLGGVNSAHTNEMLWYQQGGFIAAAAPSILASAGTYTASTVHQITYVMNGASTVIRVDGTQVASGTVGGNDISSFYMGGSYITPNWAGLVGEAFMYTDNKSAAHINLVELYLKRRWAL